MSLWKAVVLVNLALALALGWGWLRWGREHARLEREVAALQAMLVGTGEAREWRSRGVVRAILPDIGVVVITHEEIPGLMAPMTMGFRTSGPDIYEGIAVGDTVRFTMRGTLQNMSLVAIEKAP